MTSCGRELPHPVSATDMTPCLAATLDALPPQASVLDVGCLGWKLLRHSPNLAHHGCDVVPPPEIPSGARFQICDIEQQDLPWGDDAFDLVVASHIIEHLHDPFRLASEMVRVCRPGGLVYLEAPSERSQFGPVLTRAPHAFFSFWDDPTHVRPWSPRAFYRLLLGYNCRPREWGHDTSLASRLRLPWTLVVALATRNWEPLSETWWRAIGFAAYVVAEKPPTLAGRQPFQYRSLQGISLDSISRHFEEFGPEKR